MKKRMIKMNKGPRKTSDKLVKKMLYKGRYKECMNPDCDEKIFEKKHRMTFDVIKFHDYHCRDKFTVMLEKEVNKRLKSVKVKLRKKIIVEWGLGEWIE